MATAGPTFYSDNAKALEIKDVANAHYRAGEHQKALDLYSSIINQYDDRVMINTICIARCNRAACYLTLGKCIFSLWINAGGIHEAEGDYQRCIDDCNIALLFQMSSLTLHDKARYRLTAATKALDDIDDQKRAADPTYPGRPKYDVGERIREQMRESSASSAKFQPKNVEEHRPFGYTVRLKGHDPEYIQMRDMVPVSLAHEAPRAGGKAYEAKRDAFVRRIVTTHEPELMEKHPWTCSNCGKPATTWLHSPISALAGWFPVIKDYARPICEKGGSCAKLIRTAMDKAEREDPEIAGESGDRVKM